MPVSDGVHKMSVEISAEQDTDKGRQGNAI